MLTATMTVDLNQQQFFIAIMTPDEFHCRVVLLLNLNLPNKQIHLLNLKKRNSMKMAVSDVHSFQEIILIIDPLKGYKF